ncbi:hypothetical protein [Streptomyces sp. NPDC057552]|uniref:hypothetical protein n=1 Tax=Streptomyces sp. NPDC057552 TaxID=3350537 RepID=UPI0036974AE9
MSDLTHDISTALGDAAEDHDIEAIAADLRARGALEVGSIPAEEFWALVEKHALSEEELTEAETGTELTELERFKAEIQAAAQTPADRAAVWTRGGITLEVKGHSRVNMTMPQPTATYWMTVGSSEPVRLKGRAVASWEGLWAAVAVRLDAWTAQVAERRAAYDRALAAKDAARDALIQAEADADHARRALAEVAPVIGRDGRQSETMTRDEVADYLGIAPVSVSKRMSRWGIDAVKEHRPRRGQARYPAAEVQAKAAARPGQGFRTDLH